jgi:hypothetical protein
MIALMLGGAADERRIFLAAGGAEQAGQAFPHPPTRALRVARAGRPPRSASIPTTLRTGVGQGSRPPKFR